MKRKEGKHTVDACPKTFVSDCEEEENAILQYIKAINLIIIIIISSLSIDPSQLNTKITYKVCFSLHLKNQLSLSKHSSINY